MSFRKSKEVWLIGQVLGGGSQNQKLQLGLSESKYRVALDRWIRRVPSEPKRREEAMVRLTNVCLKNPLISPTAMFLGLSKSDVNKLYNALAELAPEYVDEHWLPASALCFEITLLFTHLNFKVRDSGLAEREWASQVLRAYFLDDDSAPILYDLRNKYGPDFI